MDKDFAFELPSGQICAFLVRDVALIRDGEELTDIELVMELDWAGYERVVAGDLFYVTVESRPENHLTLFHHDQPLFLKLRLAKECLDGVEPDNVLASLPTATDKWYGLSVWQPIVLDGGMELKAGYDTVWTRPVMKQEVVGPIREAVMAYFASEDWPYELLAGMSVLRLEFKGGYGQWYCFAQMREAEGQFVFYSACPMVAPAGRRPAIAELLTRINFGLIMGNFEMDFNDGEIRFKTSIDVEGTVLSPELIRPIVNANVTMMDRYLPSIVKVLEGVTDPAGVLTD